MISCQNSNQKRLNDATVAQQTARIQQETIKQATAIEYNASQIPKLPKECGVKVVIDPPVTIKDSMYVAASKTYVALEKANDTLVACYYYHEAIRKGRIKPTKTKG